MYSQLFVLGLAAMASVEAHPSLGRQSKYHHRSLIEKRATPATTVSGWSYIGCYKDNGNDRTLSASKKIASTMTPSACVAYCSDLGYSYAGLEYYDECYCGNSIDSTKLDVDTRCQFACKGDSSQACGGDTRLGVYYKGGSTSTSATYVGCYKDNGDNRTLNGNKKISSSMTPSVCNSYCSGLGYTYAGTEYYDECYCGNILDSSKVADNSQCQFACKGDSSQKCGGDTRLGVYSLGGSTTTTSSTTSTSAAAASTSVSATYVGCYKDNGDNRTLNGSKKISSSMTPSVCNSYCSGLGYTYAGTEYYDECYCGNILDSSKVADNSQCQFACKGDSSQKCGGDTRLGVYSLGGSTTMTSTTSSTTAASTSVTVSANAAVTSTVGVAAVPKASSTKALYAHHMVGNTYSYKQSTWADDISLASAAGIDGFALNYGIDTWQPARIADAYAAAKAQGSFKLFLSLDVSSLSCSTASDAATHVASIATYSTHSAQVTYNGKVLVSTFSGESCTFGQGSVSAGWTYFRSLLTAKGISIYFLPSIFSDISTFSSNSWMDGEFNWNGGWPTGSTALSTSSDTSYMSALGSKGYMAPVAPCFFTYYSPSTYNKDWIYRSDDWLLARRMEQIISMRNSFDMAEIISWNDYGESHYIGPIRADQPNSQGWTNGMPHTAWLSLIAYYAPAFKTGSYPSASDQMIFWTRPHPKAANPTAPTCARPSYWNNTDDILYVWVALKAAATVTITSGSNTGSWYLPAGVSKIGIASAAGSITGKIVRSGTTVKNYDSSGSFSYTLNPTDYNYNYFVAAV
ncbi:glucan endo-1,3-alpha-glucosidase agn1 [Cryptococcus neoformans Bt85]|nr:glucan endo-1,3-alpha-glucosidase agn1 [Cryptococcus neoformans var. grubii Bt85]